MLMQTHEARLDALRKELARQGLDGFVIPISDEHLSEYVGAYAQRLAWLTGFGGSAGTARCSSTRRRCSSTGATRCRCATRSTGGFTITSRYRRTRSATGSPRNAGECAGSGSIRGCTPRDGRKTVRKALADVGAELVPVAPIRSTRCGTTSRSPRRPRLHPGRRAGRALERRQARRVAEWLRQEKLDAAVISALDSVAWLLNVRGTDVERTPGGAVLRDRPCRRHRRLVHRPRQSAARGRRASRQRGARAAARRVRPPRSPSSSGKRVAADPERSVAAIFSALEEAGAEAVRLTDPVVLPKAIKNEAERAGHRAAQARDGAAVARFLHWLSVEGPKSGVDELSAAARLQQFRKDTGDLRDLSFDTISGAGPNGGNRALPGERGDQPPARAGQRVPRRFRRAICRRHHRHQPARCGSGRGKRRPR
jgi:Xaa-Pro aminopeptidase